MQVRNKAKKPKAKVNKIANQEEEEAEARRCSWSKENEENCGIKYSKIEYLNGN